MKMSNKVYRFELTSYEKQRQIYGDEHIYGSERRDRTLLEQAYLPRYAVLARKVLLHYGKEHYNPHTVDLGTERFIRTLVQCFIENKIFNRQKEYDWEYIDHSFRKAVGSELKIEIPYDQAVLDRGLAPEHKITYSHPNNTTVN